MSLKMSNTLNLKACAKINLFLEICGKRPDGYHNIKTVMQSVDLCDSVGITLKSEGGVTLKTQTSEINNTDNIVIKAANAFFESVRSANGAEITLNKSIPLSAGLGGGSADAAAVIMGLNVLLGHPLKREGLINLAATIGADVPFCLFGGTLLASSIGEQLFEVPKLPTYKVVLIKHHQKQSTGQMYALADSLENHAVNANKALNTLNTKGYESAFSQFGNDFLLVSKDYDAITQIIKQLYKMGAVYAGLSGSGPTVFGLFENVNTLDLDTLKQHYKEVYICNTIYKGII